MASGSVTHKFVSSKADGADGTKVRKTNWNDAHNFTGGTHGELLFRDTLSTEGASWLDGPAQANQVLRSAGSGLKPTWGPIPLTIDTQNGVVLFADGSAAAPSIAFAAQPGTGLYRISGGSFPGTIAVGIPSGARFFVTEDAGGNVVHALGFHSVLGSGGAYAWGTPATGNEDLALVRDAAGILAQRNGVNSQEFRLYNTFTDASNYERLTSKFVTDHFEITTEAAGTGSTRILQLKSSNGPVSLRLGLNGNAIAPDGDNINDLGTSGNAFRDIYLGRDIIINRNIVMGNGFIEAVEMTAPSAPGANTSRMFTRDNGAGKTQLAIIFPTGAIQVIATEP